MTRGPKLKSSLRAAFAFSLVLTLGACQGQMQPFTISDGSLVPDSPATAGYENEAATGRDEHDHDHETELDESSEPGLVIPFACKRATNSQIAKIKQGNSKFDEFMKGCWAATGNSRWCEQLTRPNPSSRSTFLCTYGEDLPHRLIHPDESTWKNAYQAVKLVEELGSKGIEVSQIYNWWRPEPYNANVGGAAGRHPYGTSVDVRMSTVAHMKKAHTQLCKWRKAGRLRALGYYGSTGLHFGIGDRTPNTWGKGCP